jgi:NAD(P)-dependent dehydrogenase (short-subunit alcohol dehydrogenase family)
MIPSLQGKTVLITGATDGLGKLVAQHAAAAEATLILHGRNRGKGEKVKQAIEAATGNPNIYYYNADLASLAEVNRLADDVLKNHQQLHVLINNAAIGGGPRGSQERELSKDGKELRFAVNYLSHFLLTKKLLPVLGQSVPARVVNVASVGQSPVDFDDLQLEKRYDSFDAYAKSKLAQILFTMELAERVKDRGIAVNCLHPATLMNTNMAHDFFGRTMSTVEEGAEAVEYIAFAEETKGITGAYFNQEEQGRANGQAYDAAARKRLWEMSEEMVVSLT